MQSIIVRFIVCLVAVWANAREARAAELSCIRVLTFNIHHGRGADGEINLARIAQTIEAAQADLVALQEVDRRTARAAGADQLRELAKLTKLHYAFGKSIDYAGGAYGVAVLSRHDISSAKTFSLPSSKDREPRVALEVRVQAPQFPPFIFVCTHLDHHSDDKDRMAQARKLAQLFSQGPSTAILAGDLNATPDSEVLKILGRHWQIADIPHLRPTAPTENPRSKIDFVLLPHRSPWKVQSVNVIEDKLSSDHLPVLAELVNVTNAN